MTDTPVGNAARSPDRSSMKAWRVHAFGPPEAMILETFLGQALVEVKFLSKFMQQGSAPGTDGSGRTRVHCRNREAPRRGQ
jgi:hypothetical protein